MDTYQLIGNDSKQLICLNRVAYSNKSNVIYIKKKESEERVKELKKNICSNYNGLNILHYLDEIANNLIYN